MFLLDNELVREDYQAAKSLVSDIVEKHGGTMHTSRRWDERRLAYTVKGRQRATYILSHFEIPGDGIPTMLRDFELNESVLRVQSLRVESVPEGEAELSAAEQADDFSIPTPPEDDAPEPEQEFFDDEDDDEDDGRRRRREPERGDDAAKEGAAEAEGAATDATPEAELAPATEEAAPSGEAEAAASPTTTEEASASEEA
jgi:small subunit ribosomal protein S6